MTSQTYKNHIVDENAQGCIVMDISMRGLTGFDIQRHLSKRAQKIPVITLSAKDREDSHNRARELGTATFFRKLIDDQALLNPIHWLLGSSNNGARKPSSETPGGPSQSKS